MGKVWGGLKWVMDHGGVRKGSIDCMHQTGECVLEGLWQLNERAALGFVEYYAMLLHTTQLRTPWARSAWLEVQGEGPQALRQTVLCQTPHLQLPRVQVIVGRTFAQVLHKAAAGTCRESCQHLGDGQGVASKNPGCVGLTG